METTITTTNNWKKYIKYIHVGAEILFFILIIIYVIRVQRNLQNQITNLSLIIQEQQKIINQQNQIFEKIYHIPSPPQVNDVKQTFEAPPIEKFATLFTIKTKEKPSDNETIIDESKTVSKDIIKEELTKDVLEKELEAEIKELNEEEKNINNNNKEEK